MRALFRELFRDFRDFRSNNPFLELEVMLLWRVLQAALVSAVLAGALLLAGYWLYPSNSSSWLWVASGVLIIASLTSAIAVRIRLYGWSVPEVVWHALGQIDVEDRDTSLALPLVYLEHAKRLTLGCSVLLFIGASCFVATAALSDAARSVIWLSGAPVVLFLVLLARVRLLEYRVSRGYFGSNAYEVRLLVEFLVRNAEQINFNDRSGGVRKVSNPDQPKSAERVQPVVGRGEPA